LCDFPAEYTNTYCIGVSNIVEFQGKHYIITGDATHTSYVLQEIYINANDTVTVAYHPIAHTNFPYDFRGFRTVDGASQQIAPYLVYTLKNIDDKYIGLTVHSNEGFGIATNHKHILIKKNSAAFVITSVISLPNCLGVLYYDAHNAVVLTTEGFTFYRLDTKSDQWTQIRHESGTFDYIAFDSYKRFYTVNTANKVSMYSNVSTYEIDVHFQHTGYQYQGQPIYTHCVVSAKNFLSDYIDTTLKVTLTGPVRFADGSTEKIIATQGDIVGEEVYICGSGQIGVHAIEVEGWS
jgi:hypothetical protein